MLYTKNFMLFVCTLILYALLCLFFIQCSDNSTPEQVAKAKQSDHISTLSEIPSHIKEVENLTIFPGDSEPTHSIELIPQLVFGEDEESSLFLIPKSFEDNNGRLIIWGSDSNRGQGVYVYNADGTYHTQLGRKGKGPGEYEIILNIDVKAGKVFVSDYTSMRLNEYTIDGYAVERSIKFEQWDNDDELKFKNFVIPRNDGNYLLAFSDETQKLGQREIIFKVTDRKGKSISNQPMVLPSGFAINTGTTSQNLKPSLPLSFMGSTVTALSKEDAFYASSTKEFLVKKYDANGIYQSAFYYPIVGPPFDLDEYLKTAGPFTPKAHQIRKAFNEMNEEFPENSPFIDRIIVDDENRIWVAIRAGVEREKNEWWILKESGELIAKLLLPRIQRIYDIKNGYLYGRKDNGKPRGYLYSGDGSEEADAEYIVKYRIELTEK